MTYDPNPPAYVYVLLDPDTREIRYVGCSEEPAKRLKSHIQDARLRIQRESDAIRPSEKDRWMHQLTEAGKMPLLAIVETADRASRKEVEARWIARLEDEGHPLLNVEVLHRQASNAQMFQDALDLGKELFGD